MQTHTMNQIPREVLFGNPVITNPILSPDGQRIAYIAPYENVLNVWLRSAAGGDERVLTRDTDRGIRMIHWAADNRHLLYIQDAGGNENFKLYTIDTDTDEVMERTPYDNVQVRIVGKSKDHPDKLLIGMNLRNPKKHDVYRLDLPTNELELVAENTMNGVGWLVDRHFRVRGAARVTEDGGSEILVREDELSEWKPVVVWSAEDSASSRPVSFSADGHSLYLVDARDSNTGRFMKLDLTSGSLEEIASDPLYDAGGALFNPDTYELEAVTFNREKVEWLLLEESVQADFQRLSNLHQGELFIKNRDQTNRIWLVGFQNDQGPTPYYSYDRETNEASLLFYDKPELANYRLAPKQPISFKSRDGFTIHGYITVPVEMEAPGPMVLTVHGGPWARDAWGYDSQAQWLANRGYVCLQVNFRGSTGYGKQFVNAGIREWGGRMHDDLVDAVEWAVQQGYADPDRVAIFGASYGGYAALAGAAFTPDLFRCAVDVVGPSNLLTLIRSTPSYWAPMLARLHKNVGNPDIDEEFLRSRSPLFHVDQIRIPILIVQGANDPRVKQAESEQIVAALKEKGLEYEYILFENEGHGFAKPENRLTFYEAAEAFLLKHLAD